MGLVGHMYRPHTRIPILLELHRRRVARKLSLPSLAATIGCCPTTLAGWERGEHSPSLFFLTAWANALGQEIILCQTKPGNTNTTRPRESGGATPTTAEQPIRSV